MKKEHPLIIVFYLDADMMKQRELIQQFAESIDIMLQRREANAMAFFIPTKGEERIECINPILVKEPEMERINKILEDIKANFLVDIPVEDNEVTLDSKPCVCKDGGECNCENK